MIEENCFSKQYTLYIKGIAILLLLWHHLFWHDVVIPIDLKNTNIFDVLIPLTKTCVALFTILSGYGLNESFKNKKISYIRFTIFHIKKLLINYWWVYIPMLVLSFWLHGSGTPIQIYGTGIKGGINFLLDFLGMRALVYSPSLNNTWWYIEAVIVFYMCFPLFHYVMKKSIAVLLLLSVIPVLFGSAGVVLGTTDRELYYIFPFVIGMILSENKILDKFILIFNRNKRESLILMLIIAVVFAFISTQIKLLSNVFLAGSIILTGIVFKILNIGIKLFCMLGKYSMDMFLVHSFVYYYFVIGKQFFMGITNNYVRYIVLVVICFIIACLLECIKNGMKVFLSNKNVVNKSC